MDKIIFDDKQMEVISSLPSDRIIIEGGPGMGKTAVACARVAFLIQQNVEPSNIWLISFTRTAIKEIKSRIDSFLPEKYKHLAKNIKISTIDSQAWHLRHGFDYTEFQELFSNYTSNILTIIEMLQSNHEGIIDFIESIEHLIVDEAQDIVGNRNQLIFEFIRKIKKSSGISIFVDSAQAIYGFANNDKFKPKPIIDRLIEEKKLKFKKIFLEKVFRTSYDSLKYIFTDLREIILDNEIKAKDKIEFTWEYLEEHANQIIPSLNYNKLSKVNNSTLLLFRKKDDLYQYSYYLLKNGISHTVRVGGCTPNISTWIGKIFGLYNKKFINKESFFELWKKRINYYSSISKEDAWEVLLQLCGNKRKKVNVLKLKEYILRPYPPIDLTSSDQDNSLILSTIHASKGREADVVYLFKTDSQLYGNENQQQEEARVLFVAATRAISKLNIIIHDGFISNQSVKISRINKRIIRNDSNDVYRIYAELDRNDISYIWSKSIDQLQLIKSIHLQSILPFWLSKVRKLTFKTKNNYQNYDVYINIDNNNFYIGKCHSKFNSRLLHIVKGLINYAEQVELPKRITAYCIGTKTIPLPYESSNISKNPYINNSLCIIPICSTFFEFSLLKTIKKPLDTIHYTEESDVNEYEELPLEILELTDLQKETSIYEY